MKSKHGIGGKVAHEPAREQQMYRIVRFYRDAGIRRRVIDTGLTLEQARAHCNDPETASSTCTGKVGKDRTRRVGEWFDGYEKAS